MQRALPDPKKGVFMPKVTLFPKSCKGIEDCGICAFVCPKSLFVASEEMNEAGYLPPKLPEDDKCTACGNCMIYCPDFAIVVEGAAADKREVNENG
jgi:2-oxoglutarate ferredoxin oxidoreductase subunit delta